MTDDIQDRRAGGKKKITLLDKVKLVVRMCGDVRLSDAAFRVAVAELLGFSNTLTGQCNPSVRLIAKACAKCRDTVIAANRKLAMLGYMSVSQSNGGRNRRTALEDAL